jgi:hypothetical protein
MLMTEDSMKSYIRTISAIAGALVLTAAAVAHAQPFGTVATVPFEFNIGETSLPRDTYRVSRLGGHTDVLLFRSVRHGVVIPSQRDGSRDVDESPRLVFHRYGDRYFLREIRMDGNLRFSLAESREEREAAGQIAERLPGSKVQIVAVRLR